MRILFLEQNPRFVGGSERMSLSLCRHALRRGHEAMLVHAGQGDMVEAYAGAGAPTRQAPILPLAVRHPLKAWRSLRLLRSLVRREGMEVIFTSQVSYVSLIGAVGHWTGARSIVHLGLTYDFRSPLFRAGMRAVDLGVAPSEHTAGDWRERGWPASALRVIPNGVDVEVFTRGDGREAAQRRLGLSSGVPLVAYVGRLVEEKGIFTLLRAFAVRQRAGATGHLLFVGAAPADEVSRLEKCAEEEGLPPQAWSVRPSTPSPEDVYRAADMVVVPSQWEEPFGLVPLEAMACGTFTLVSDRGILPELVSPVGNSAVFPAGDVPALAGRLEQWLGSPEDRGSAAVLLAQSVRERYSFDRCGDQYLKEFSALVG